MGDAVTEHQLVRVETRMADIAAAGWDACANPPTRVFNPFISHAFLKALEDSGSVSADAGWLPQHLVLEACGARPLGCMPLYLKSHSQGEYVFDHGWADAFERAGGAYYPKLQCSIPFTPATGRRLLVPEGPKQHEHERMLLQASLQLCERLDASSLHLTFLTEDEWSRLGKLGLLRRIDQQFHWKNNGYGSFDDFLSELSSRKRKAVRKERDGARASGVEIEWISGRDILEAHWDAFFAFYVDTGSRKWGSPYLTRDFFSLVGQAMPQRILLVLCKHAGRYIAGALNFIGGDTLYGRYWGCTQDHRFLHFEACYYQAIEYAIAHRLAFVEAGAQGLHKLSRGYLPVTTYSAHYVAHAGLRRAVSDYLEHERAMVAHEAAVLADHSPFRSQENDPSP